LNWTYGFAHHAAEQEFRRAAQADPSCAMAYWGIALVNGPHINFPMMRPENNTNAWEAITRAQELAVNCSLREQGLIRALSQRYAQSPPEDRGPLDQAYAEAMRKLWHQFPEDADIGALCAESAMDLHPWDLWKNELPQPWTDEILQTLERSLKLDPKHPGANHYYIHTVEASPTPGCGLRSADLLMTLVPDASHLVHMPAHIYARVGDWERAQLANERAMAVDQRYRAVYPRPGFYRVYMSHNTHFLAFVSMMRGESGSSVRLARAMIASIPDDFLKEYSAAADGFMVFVPEVLMRFGKWEELLREEAPRGNLPYSTAYWHFTRAVGLNALGLQAEAEVEKGRFLELKSKLPPEVSFGNNSGNDLLAIAEKVLTGEMLARQNRLDEAVAALREGVRLEDKLKYDEPPDWIQPVRHTLGAVLLRAKKAGEAEQVYRDDLKKWPRNGWALLGLKQSLSLQGRGTEAARVDAELKKAWANSDVKPMTSCYCQAGL